MKRIAKIVILFLILIDYKINGAYHWIQNDSWVEGDPVVQVQSFKYCPDWYAGYEVCVVFDILEDCVIDKIGVVTAGSYDDNFVFDVRCYEGHPTPTSSGTPGPGTPTPTPTPECYATPFPYPGCLIGSAYEYSITGEGFWVLDLNEYSRPITRHAGEQLVVCLLYMGSLPLGTDEDQDVCEDTSDIILNASLIHECRDDPPGYEDWVFGEDYGLSHNLIIRAGWEVPDPTETPTIVPTSTPTSPPTNTPAPPTWTSTPIPTYTPTITPTNTFTPDISPTPAATNTQIPTVTYTPTAGPPTVTPSPPPTSTATMTSTPSPFPPTHTPTPVYSPTYAPTVTFTPTSTATPTVIPSPTPTYEPYRLPFFDDFEEILPWQTQTIYGSCLWHRETNRYHSEFHSWAYNKGDPEFNYNTGARNSCSLISPLISLAGTTHPIFTYWDWIDVENREGYDICYTEISTDFGNSWSLLSQAYEPANYWRLRGPYDLSAFVGRVILIRFRFDTVDSQFNNFEGWYIDDVSIQETPETTPTPTPYSGPPGVDLKLNEDVFYEGMRFLLELDYLNPTAVDLPVDVYIILDVYGSYWYWPSWEQSVDFASRTISQRTVTSEVILDFTWPSYDGSFSDVVIWAAALYANTSDLFGDYDYVTFGCNL